MPAVDHGEEGKVGVRRRRRGGRVSSPNGELVEDFVGEEEGRAA